MSDETIDPKVLAGEAPLDLPANSVVIPRLPGADAIAAEYRARGVTVIWADLPNRKRSISGGMET